MTSQPDPKPVAYDAHGRPLYAHPPASPAPTPPIVHVARPHEPVAPHISPETAAKHKLSLKKYPMLNLSEGEYVITAIRRHPIGIIGIWGSVVAMIVLVCVVLPLLIVGQNALRDVGLSLSLDTGLMGLVIIAALCLLFLLGGYVAAYVYNANRFYLTNESVTQHIQTSLFSKKEQTISLSNIEDASFRQHGILQHLFNYGSLRLSTEGDETTYRFNYVSNPRVQVTLLNDAVEAFKNGRPVESAD